ncbi:MAG: glutathione synthase [Alphaproteobacteria bacterium]
MSLAVAIQMDPVESINIDTDSSFVLGLEAQQRGHALFHYLPRDLSFRQGRVIARARELQFKREKGNHAKLGEAQMIDLATLDIVLMRQDPPFDMAYVTATHLLEQVHPNTLVVNDPIQVRNAPEKLFVTRFEGLMPPTLITSDSREIVAFRSEHKDIILKPLFGNGGSDVFHIALGDENLFALIEMFSQRYREPIIVQRYIPEVRDGDKRIILIEGEAAGAMMRVPPRGEARANLHAGGRAHAAKLSFRDKEICDAIGPALRERGLVFVGIDVIGNYLTEINVTSPTGIQEIDRFDSVSLESKVWDAIEARFANRHRGRPIHKVKPG